jgi:hypothetical protein
VGTGVIHGCWNQSSGALRVIVPARGQHCARSEVALDWNKLGINWRGSWQARASYAAGDAVLYQGSSWLAKQANTDAPPPGAAWHLLAAAGESAGVSVSVPQPKTPLLLDYGQDTLTTVMTTPAATTAGQYYLNASIMLQVDQGDTIACIAAVNGAKTGEYTTVGPVATAPKSGSSPPADDAQSYETLPLAADVDVPAGGRISIECAGYVVPTSPTPSSSFYDGAITATLINSDNPAAGTARAGSPPPPIP